MSSIIPLSTVTSAHADAARLEEVGGKAHSLIAAKQQGLPVPGGFVLTVHFFEPWFAAIRGTDAHQVTNWATFAQEPMHCSKNVLSKLRFSDKQREEIDTAMNVSFHQLALNEGRLFAVRSSSPEEDLDGASFAGAYVTSLGVTIDQIESAVIRSFVSMFDKRVWSYKQQQHHGKAASAAPQPRIAVIVQEQIAATVAGVAFSVNPLNNCYDEAVVNANFGLGESVVSGMVEPDQFVIDKVSRTIVDARVGSKEIIIKLDKDGGTSRTTRTATVDSSNPCLTSEQALALTDLLVEVEGLQGKPVDIEWAFCDDELFLLQARPITTYLPLPNEMITPSGSRKYLYADSTLIEQGIDKPLSVLGIDFVNYVLQQMASTTAGGSVDSSVHGIAFTAGGRYYMNLSHSIKLMGRSGALAPGSAGDETVMSILDSIDSLDEEYLPETLPPQLKDMQSQMPMQMLKRAPSLLRAFFRPESLLRQYQESLPAQINRFENVIDSSLSLKQQVHKLTELLSFFFEFGMPMVIVPQFAYSRIRNMFIDDNVEEELLSLGVALPGNLTSAMGAAMADMASSEIITTHDSSEMFLQSLEEETVDDPNFLQAWDCFMAEFGARCPREIDVATIRPREEPALLFEQLKSMALSRNINSASMTAFESGSKKREAAYQTLRRIAQQKGWLVVKSFDHYYRVWVTLGGQRENGKHYIIKVVDLFRQVVQNIAGELVSIGRLDNKDQIFDLAIDDIDAAMQDQSLDVRKVRKNRSEEITRIARSSIVACVLDSRGKVFYPPTATMLGENVFRGVPISPGVVQGRVKVLNTATEKPLLPGEILVTRCTDPGWTPLFITAGGLVLEIGGALQHGAVVAHEYGLPCVSGLRGVSDLLHDGQLVEIDGTNGLVRVLNDAEL